MGIRDLAAKAMEKLRTDNPRVDDGEERTGDKFDNAPRDRYDKRTTQESINERPDDFLDTDPAKHRRDTP